jgi:hypothetical protein
MHQPTTIPQQIAELRRELATRQRVYPDWVRGNKLSQATADHRTQAISDTIRTLETVLELLFTLAPGCRQAPAEGQQATLFTPEQVPATTPSRGLYAEH